MVTNQTECSSQEQSSLLKLLVAEMYNPCEIYKRILCISIAIVYHGIAIVSNRYLFTFVNISTGYNPVITSQSFQALDSFPAFTSAFKKWQPKESINHAFM